MKNIRAYGAGQGTGTYEIQIMVLMMGYRRFMEVVFSLQSFGWVEGEFEFEQTYFLGI